MNEDQKSRVQELVEELDRLVPRTDAVVVINIYGGGPDESQITATENGYLRLGIEMLKAPSALGFIDGRDIQLDVNLEGLVSEQSDINFHLFHLDDTLKPDAAPAAPQARQPWPDTIAGTVCGLVCLALAYVFAVGLETIGRGRSETMTVTLKPETALRERARRAGQDIDTFTNTLLADVLAEDPDDLTEDEMVEIRAGIERGLEAAAGRVRSAADYKADVMKRRAERQTINQFHG